MIMCSGWQVQPCNKWLISRSCQANATSTSWFVGVLFWPVKACSSTFVRASCPCHALACRTGHAHLGHPMNVFLAPHVVGVVICGHFLCHPWKHQLVRPARLCLYQPAGIKDNRVWHIYYKETNPSKAYIAPCAVTSCPWTRQKRPSCISHCRLWLLDAGDAEKVFCIGLDAEGAIADPQHVGKHWEWNLACVYGYLIQFRQKYGWRLRWPHWLLPPPKNHEQNFETRNGSRTSLLLLLWELNGTRVQFFVK